VQSSIYPFEVNSTKIKKVFGNLLIFPGKLPN
jgi:hypothetical protein